MDASVRSDPNESQATQLLDELLRDPRSLTSRLAHSNEVSSDSLPSPRHSNTLPQYHFHGLAETQTQSQHQEQEEGINEGENIGVQKYGKDTEPRLPPVDSTSHAVYTEISIVNSHRGPANKRLASPALLMQVPPKKPTTRSSSLKPRFIPYDRPRLRSDSQDSFACDPSDKPEEQFLAKSDKFALPLSELGEHSSPTRGPSNGTSLLYPRETGTPPAGRVLVDATPSHSGSSLNDEPHNMFQKLEETQLMEDENPQRTDETMMVDKDGSGYESSQPSSSYHRFLDGDRRSDLQATQPSTPVADSNAIFLAEDAIPWNNIHSVPASSGPNSLISMVAPHNRWRYRQHMRSGQSAQGCDSIQHPTSGHGTINQGAMTGLPFRPAPSFLASRPNESLLRSSPPSSVLLDAVDVVPESEPVEQNLQPLAHRLQHRIRDYPLPPLNDGGAGKGDVDRAASDQLRKITAQKREEEDEEEEIPLAALARKALPNQAHGDRSTKSKRLVPSESTRAPSANLVTAAKGKKTTPASNQQSKARSWETTVVPSSVPEQDIASEQRNLHKIKAEKAAALKERPARTRAPRSRNQRRPRRTLVKNKQESESSDEACDRDDIEPVDEGNMLDGDETHSKKRKRSDKAPASTRNTRAATNRAKRNVQTPDPRPRRLQTALWTGSRLNMEEPTRVFALWKEDYHYYPGVIHADIGNSEYIIKFDDDTEGSATLDQMRLCMLRVGDNVLIANRFRPSRVTSVHDEEGEIYVELDGEDTALHLSSLRIANKTILYDWGDRILSRNAILPAVKPAKPHLSPSPSKLSMLSVQSSRAGRKKLLARTGLIVTLTASRGNWEKEKEKVMNAVRSSGGIVIDDLSAIIRMEGKHSQSGNAWIIRKGDVEWIGDEEIERLFLVADEPNQKPKFLFALALGIPCLDANWLRDSVEAGREKDWLAYLLPQGHSEALVARPSQQVDIDWGNSPHHLTKIMSNAVPSKIFAKKSILCVGIGMVPQPRGRRKAGTEDKAQEATNAVPRIILAMGAETVEAVTEIRYASKENHEYGYIIIREPSLYSVEFIGCTTVTWTWVKESLIASRHLPLPEWPSVEYSQEA